MNIYLKLEGDIKIYESDICPRVGDIIVFGDRYEITEVEHEISPKSGIYPAKLLCVTCKAKPLKESK